MRKLQDEVREIVGRDGLISRRDHPELRGATERLLRTGELVPVLPGICSTPVGALDRGVRVHAAARRDPDAVFVDRTAAQLSYWPKLAGDEVSCAVSTARTPAVGFRFVRRRVPAELVQEHGGLRTTVPALTALDLCGEVEGDGIDRALLTRTATLAGLHRALNLTGGRRGNRDRRALLLDSRDEPWSAAERLCHRLLHDARIAWWKANLAVVIEGHLYYLDVAFPGLKLAVEIDGRLHETDEDLFESDRWRQNALVLDGWMVLRFTWAMLRDHPEVVVRDIKTAIAIRRRRFPGRR
ncbi:endonuclease domain-containing protein [Microlunatus antarcticus]|uniref:Very-short-patch-repair endonuclease n=1 Tax=Microlunatus antarcticus TaxID=53388 RepID=A0A7W5JYP8_9ACTN|nr:very-short-patch-repair endonuclease [Microlunatus antarcticus]